MTLTHPTASTRKWARKHDEIVAALHDVVDRLPPRRKSAAIATASKPSIRYQRYRKNGLTRVRKARGSN